MAGLEFAGISKAFADGTEAVGGLHLTVADGELVVLVGPSGCGKSTALRLIAGLEAPTAGGGAPGRAVTGEGSRARNSAMVFQNYALYPHMTVAANLAFPLKMAGVPVRRPAPARRHGTGAGSGPGRVPHGRAVVQPRRQSAGAHPPAPRRRRLALGDQKMAIPAGAGPVVPAEGEMLAGLRPEAFHSVKEAPQSRRLVLRVRVREYLGHETLVYLEPPVATVDPERPQGWEAPALVARLPGDAAVPESGQLALAVNPEAFHWFSAEGEALPCRAQPV